jgi:hypothetical protein
MRFAVGTIAVLFSILFIALTYFIVGMIQLVGMGKGFWAVPIVWIDILLGIASIGLWWWIIFGKDETSIKG